REKMKNDIKILLGIKDTIQDGVLDILIGNTEQHLLSLLKKVNDEMEDVPLELDYIIQEITIRRFNRLGSEGMKSESVEGHSVNFYDVQDEFAPYLTVIEGYRK